jgi:hypothetical protein
MFDLAFAPGDTLTFVVPSRTDLIDRQSLGGKFLQTEFFTLGVSRVLLEEH